MTIIYDERKVKMSKEPTIAQLLSKASELGVTEESARTMIKEQKIRSFTKLASVIAEKLATAGSSAKVKVRSRKAVVLHQRGPRGFKFGPVWMRSIIEGKGVALKPQNLPKLRETATFHGVQVTEDLSQVEIANEIAKVCA